LTVTSGGTNLAGLLSTVLDRFPIFEKLSAFYEKEKILIRV